ncbi:MAG TPA: serpin family protein [Jiangellaceae bacterium]|nr:serpin family protein [Jiangellaceae bacterium]
MSARPTPMRYWPLLVTAVLLLAACGSRDAPATSAGEQPVGDPAVERPAARPDGPVEALAAGFNAAGFALLRTLPVEDNVVFSPASISHALLMAHAAADNATAAAIEDVLELAAEQAPHEAWNNLDQQLAAAQGDDITVVIADRIWPRVDVEPDPDWLELLATYHNAGVEPLDFLNDPDGSRNRINGWVGEQTEGLIPELLPDGFIKPRETVLVLTDTLYFKARWARPFGKYPPITGQFTRLDGSTVDMEFMQELELDDLRGAGDGYVGAEIPYAGGELSMLVIMPDEGRFAELRDGLDQAFLDEIDATFTRGPYELRLPAWRTRTELDLMGWLEASGVAPGHYPAIAAGVFLGEAVHGADIAVDEWGTVAAAATALGFEESGAPEPELVVAADHPFLYLVRHRESGLVLFAGQVTDPTA